MCKVLTGASKFLNQNSLLENEWQKRSLNSLSQHSNRLADCSARAMLGKECTLQAFPFWSFEEKTFVKQSIISE